MPNLLPCPSCGRHHKQAEQACPHCGVAVAHPGMGMLRNLKVGALLAFTAATTAACYGAAPPNIDRPTPKPSASATLKPGADPGATSPAKP